VIIKLFQGENMIYDFSSIQIEPAPSGPLKTRSSHSLRISVNVHDIPRIDRCVVVPKVH